MDDWNVSIGEIIDWFYYYPYFGLVAPSAKTPYFYLTGYHNATETTIPMPCRVFAGKGNEILLCFGEKQLACQQFDVIQNDNDIVSVTLRVHAMCSPHGGAYFTIPLMCQWRSISGTNYYILRLRDIQLNPFDHTVSASLGSGCQYTVTRYAIDTQVYQDAYTD